MAKNSRKTRYNQEIEDFIVEHYAIGFGLPRIAKALGFPLTTVTSWPQRKPKLRTRLAAARMAEATRRLASTGNEWWLERKCKEFRKPREEVNVTGEISVNHLLEIRKRMGEVPGLDGE